MSILFKRIKDWATSITTFREGDVIPVDGPSGTAKMSKDTLLSLTAASNKKLIDDLVSDESIGLSDEAITTRETPNFTNCLVRSGHTYRIAVKCATITVADDPRIGLYLYKGTSNVGQITHLTPSQLNEGVEVTYTATSDGDIRIRTLEFGVGYNISVSRVFKATEILDIIHVGGGYVRKTVTTLTDGPVDSGVFLKKGVHYVCSANAIDSWESSSTDARIGVYLYYTDGTFAQVVSCSAAELKFGVSFDVTPVKDCIVRPRALEAGIEIAVTAITAEEKVGDALADMRLKIDTLSTEWLGKTWAAFGDSITAISNGDSLNVGWAKYVNDKLLFSEFHGRGIGGSSFAWKTGGGTVAFINSTTGNYNSRDPDGHNKDDYTGAIPAGCVATRSSFCSWDRIIHMFPASIKDTIDLIFVMGGTNDTVDNTDAAFVSNDTTDPEWAASTYYTTYGGDYNIGTFKGGIASTIMKLNAWMPQALIVVGTPLSGYGPIGQISTSVNLPEYNKSKDILEMAKRCSCPCIDVFATDGIMPFNRNLYITDNVHPYNAAGQKMLARAVIAGLKNVMPNL